MNIIPISSYPVQTSSVPGAAAAQGGQGTGGVPFKDMFNQALDNVNGLNDVKNDDALNLAVGDVDDLAAISINAEKAEIAFQLLVQMRNKMVDAYQEIMRINV